MGGVCVRVKYVYWICIDVPGFKSLPIQEQIMRVQESMYPIVLSLLSTDYNLDTRQYNYFNMTREEEEVVLNLFPEFRALVPTFHMLGYSVRKVDLDNTEMAFLCALKVMSAGNARLGWYYSHLVVNSYDLAGNARQG